MNKVWIWKYGESSFPRLPALEPFWLHSCSMSVSWSTLPESLPLISPSHPLQMFSRARARSDVYRDISRSNKEFSAAARQRFWLYLIYKYSLALGSLVSMLFLPHFSPFQCLCLILPHSCSLTTIWHLVTICQAICLWCQSFLHYIRGCINDDLYPSNHAPCMNSCSIILCHLLCIWGDLDVSSTCTKERC